MIEASLIGVLKTVLIIVLVVVLLRFIARWAVRAGMRKMQRKMREQFEGKTSQEEASSGSRQKKQFGDVTVEFDPQKGKEDGTDKKNGDDGDYVDFEELDDR
ncbi:MAG: DUF4834 family protein [Flavobacteriales bacterium]